MTSTVREFRRFLWEMKGDSHWEILDPTQPNIGFHTFSLCVLKCVHVCFSLVKVKYNLQKSFVLQGIRLPSIMRAEVWLQDRYDKTATFSCFLTKPSRHFGDKKAISATMPLCWLDWFEKRKVVSQDRIAEVSSLDSDKFHWDFHFKQQHGRNMF